MKLAVIEEKYNIIGVLKDPLKEYNYIDKLGKRVIFTRYELAENKFIDVGRNRKIKKSKTAPLVYNLFNVVNSIKENKGIIVVTENENTADVINKRLGRKGYVATTFLGGLDRVKEISLKTLQNFKGAEKVFILDSNYNEHTDLRDLLKLACKKVIEIKSQDTKKGRVQYQYNKEIKCLVDMLDKYKR